jgi:nitrate reductase NapE component
MDTDPNRASIAAFVFLMIVIGLVLVGIVGAFIGGIWWMK